MLMEFLHTQWFRLKARFKEAFPRLHAKLPALVELTRLNKPIGIYLLLWPTITALWIASEGMPTIKLLFIFVLGTGLMRSAGCSVNDFADYRFDGLVERTQGRPLATGMLTRMDALYCFGALALAGFLLVLFTNLATVYLSIAGVALAALYPFMKRFTNLPQVVLGVAFSWGILMAFTAVDETVPQPAYLLFIANLIWIVAYDTEYAMVDREFDKEIGIKSTAILFGDADKYIIAMLQFMFIIAMWLAGRQFDMGSAYFVSLVAAAVLLAYQQYLIRDRVPGQCFKAFLNNNWVGAAIFVGVFLNYL
ncbi:MAG: 4-hydroxybenzoate octaprenyltransferase [Gammaproteobacteria bacterium]